MAGLCAGSAGGGRHPHGQPPRLPSQCEADPVDGDDVNEEELIPMRRGRQGAKGLKVIQCMQELGGRIPVYFDGDNAFGTYKAVGEDSNLFSSQLGIEVRNACDPGHPSWLDVPEDERATARARMDEMFIIPPNDPRVEAGIDVAAGRLYSLWKNRLGELYRKHGGPDNLSHVKTCVPSKLSVEKWESFVDYYSLDHIKTKSTNNRRSRMSNPLPTCQGRSSMSQRCTKNTKNPSMDLPTVSTADGWAPTKKKKDGSWVDPSYEALYDQMQQGMTQLTQQHLLETGETDGASASTTQLTPRDQKLVIQSVLKPRRDFLPGIGPRVSRHSRTSSQSSSNDGTTCSSSRPSVIREQSLEI